VTPEARRELAEDCLLAFCFIPSWLRVVDVFVVLVLLQSKIRNAPFGYLPLFPFSETARPIFLG
jgi:hypothetical protein